MYTSDLWFVTISFHLLPIYIAATVAFCFEKHFKSQAGLLFVWVPNVVLSSNKRLLDFVSQMLGMLKDVREVRLDLHWFRLLFEQTIWSIDWVWLSSVSCDALTISAYFVEGDLCCYQGTATPCWFLLMSVCAHLAQSWHTTVQYVFQLQFDC